ncbi:MAG: diadenylate cyclase CdaA [Anaerolineae bacterium]
MLPNTLNLLERLEWTSAVDILLVALIFYWLLTLIQGTQAVNLMRGMLILGVLAVVVTSFVQLTALSWLVEKSLPALLLTIPVIFQPEVRRALERLGRTTGLFARPVQSQNINQNIRVVATTAQQLSQLRHGALIVLERDTGLNDYIETGVPLDSAVSCELLRTIFYPNTALHDGAVIIQQDRVAAAGCLLPLSRATHHDHQLGTRHRAALGISEATDAITVIISEETGLISVAYNGRLIRRLDEQRLVKVLRTFYRNQLEEVVPRWRGWFHRLRWGPKTLPAQTSPTETRLDR